MYAGVFLYWGRETQLQFDWICSLDSVSSHGNSAPYFQKNVVVAVNVRVEIGFSVCVLWPNIFFNKLNVFVFGLSLEQLFYGAVKQNAWDIWKLFTKINFKWNVRPYTRSQKQVIRCGRNMIGNNIPSIPIVTNPNFRKGAFIQCQTIDVKVMLRLFGNLNVWFFLLEVCPMFF